jgi:hypothetical protein
VLRRPWPGGGKPAGDSGVMGSERETGIAEAGVAISVRIALVVVAWFRSIGLGGWGWRDPPGWRDLRG